MPKLSHLTIILIAGSAGIAPAQAQLDAPPIPSALPKVSSISISNAAGVLRYCMQNNLVSNTGADVVLTLLPRKPDEKSADFVAGQAGEIHGDAGKNFAIPGAPNYLQWQACDLVLQQAKTFK